VCCNAPADRDFMLVTIADGRFDGFGRQVVGFGDCLYAPSVELKLTNDDPDSRTSWEHSRLSRPRLVRMGHDPAGAS
jgi:hypothetical protein